MVSAQKSIEVLLQEVFRWLFVDLAEVVFPVPYHVVRFSATAFLFSKYQISVEEFRTVKQPCFHTPLQEHDPDA